MANRLYVSFWDLCLDNLPQGRFERRMIGAGDASQMIRAAHAHKSLLCVSKDDLLAPYRAKKRRRPEALYAVLRASYNYPLRFEDFLTASDDQETAAESIAPLRVAELKPGDRLLVVTCNYQLADNAKRNGDFEDCFALGADAVGFHLLAGAACESLESGSGQDSSRAVAVDSRARRPPTLR